ncbi:MAG: calcium-binding protein [Methyloligellaceae bacterium]
MKTSHGGDSRYFNYLNGSGNDDGLNGGDQTDWILGNRGNDLIIANGGDDLIAGGTGNDHILAGSGNDLVNGNQGVDFMDGGPGSDMFFGGSGADIFSFGILPYEGSSGSMPSDIDGDIIADYNYIEGDVILIDRVDLIHNITQVGSDVHIVVDRLGDYTLDNRIIVQDSTVSLVSDGIVDLGLVPNF